MKPYEKTKEDESREASDLKSNAVMRWLLNQDAFKFNPGDIIIKKTRHFQFNPHSTQRSETWETEVITRATGAPKKYVYAFENQLGIGYIRQLKANGEGYCGTLICVANFDPENTRFELDPDYIDHTLVGEGNFEYNVEYQQKKKFRQEAMEANKKLLVKTSSKKTLVAWFLGLKVGDEFWFGQTFDDLVATKYKITAINKGNKPKKEKDPNNYTWQAQSYSIAEQGAHDFLDETQWQTIDTVLLSTQNQYARVGAKGHMNIGSFHWKKVSMTEPHPMKDQLCGPPK